MTKTRPSAANTGRKRDGDAGSVSSRSDSTTRRTDGQALRLPSGRIGGVVFGDTLRKVSRGSLHMLRKPAAWALDAAILDQAEQLGVRCVEVEDQETGTVYRCSLAVFRRRGVRFNRGFGPQVYLSLDNWQSFPVGWKQPVLFGA